jgi:hypothetical protein
MNIGFAPSLAIIFIILKLIGAINWPWIWVIAPLWIGALLIIFCLIGIKIMVFFYEKQYKEYK